MTKSEIEVMDFNNYEEYTIPLLFVPHNKATLYIPIFNVCKSLAAVVSGLLAGIFLKKKLEYLAENKVCVG